MSSKGDAAILEPNHDNTNDENNKSKNRAVCHHMPSSGS